MPRILIVEDDPSIRFGLEEALGQEGHEVAVCERGDETVERTLAVFPADLILLDVMLPGRNGYDTCAALRRAGVHVPILMLTAKGQETDKVTGLECGADDYVTKPFGLRELMARIAAHLRRVRDFTGTGDQPLPAVLPFQIGPVRIDPANHTLTDGGRVERLTPRECGLLVYLQRHRGRLLPRDEILENVWGVSAAVTTRTLDQTVAQVRRKLGDNAGEPRWILTVHGVGYRLSPDESPL